MGISLSAFSHIKLSSNAVLSVGQWLWELLVWHANTIIHFLA